MMFNRQALVAALVLSASGPSSSFVFQPSSFHHTKTLTAPASSSSRLSAVVVDTSTAPETSSSVDAASAGRKKEQMGAMMDLTGIALSGLKGQALSLEHSEFPKANELRSVIPAECFEPDTLSSLGYLSVSLLGTAACTAIGAALVGVVNPANPLTWPLWAAYSAVTGTVAMGLWVLGKLEVFSMVAIFSRSQLRATNGTLFSCPRKFKLMSAVMVPSRRTGVSRMPWDTSFTASCLSRTLAGSAHMQSTINTQTT